MDTPRILLAGLKFKKTLRECAPEEHNALGPSLQKLLFTTRVDGPPESLVVKKLMNCIVQHTPLAPIIEPKAIGIALTDFCAALEQYTINRIDISELCCALRQYRNMIDKS